MTRSRGTPKRVARWATSAAQAASPEDAVTLSVEGLGGSLEVLRRWKAADLTRGEAFGAEVCIACEDDADGRDGMTRYRLAHVDTDGETVTSFLLRRAPSEDSGVEGASPEGLVQMAMRHNEAMARQLAGQNEQFIRMTNAVLGVLERVTERSAQQETALAEAMQLRAANAQAEAEAGVAMLEAESKAELYGRVGRFLDLAMPKLLESLSGDERKGAEKVIRMARAAAQKKDGGK